MSKRKTYENKQHELKRQPKLLRTIIDSLPDSIYVKDAEARKIVANKIDCLYCGFEKEEDLIGKNDFDLFPPEVARKFHEDDMQVLREGKKILNREEQVTGPGGEPVVLLTSKLPLHDNDGNVIGIVGIGRDITERKKALQEIQRQLEEKEIILKEVNHRIKNNFATVESLLMLQSDSAESPEVVSALKDAIARVRSMRVLYEKLLVSDDYDNISLRDYLTSLVESIIATFPGHEKIHLSTSMADFEVSSRTLFNLGIIINELLTNCMKYAFKGRDKGLIQVNLERKESRVKLVVQDDGIGMPEDFDAGQSKGFGLMLVRMLVHQMGGSFALDSHNGARCVIKFTL